MGTPEDNEFSATLDNTNAETQAVETQDSTVATVDWEKRFKDTQAAFTKSQQELVKAKATLQVLNETAKVDLQLTAEQQEELNDLKYDNPEEWRIKLGKIERDAQDAHNTKISQAEKELSQLELRKLTFDDFSASHPDIVINDEVIKFDVPFRIKDKLEKGEVTFEEFLQESYDYLKAPKKVGTSEKTLEQVNLGKVGGGSFPSDSAINGESIANYKNEIY